MDDHEVYIQEPESLTVGKLNLVVRALREALYQQKLLTQAARDKRDAEWREAADNSFEDIQSNEALLSVFPDLPEAVMHEVWKRDPRVQAARDEISKASGAFLEAWDSAESNRGCYSCCDEHDCRCRTRYAKPEPCNCGRVELNATGEALRLTLDPDGRLAGALGKGDADAD